MRLREMRDGESTPNRLRSLAGQGGCDEVIVLRIGAKRAVDPAGDWIGGRGGIAARSVKQDVSDGVATLELARDEGAKVAIVQR